MSQPGNQPDKQERAAEPNVAGPQSEAAVTSAVPTTAVFPVPHPTVFTAEQRTLLRAVLDTIVPANGALQGAGGLGVDATIDDTLAQTPGLRRLLLDGLAEIAVTSDREAGRPFEALDAAAREGVLRSIEAAQPVFFAALVEHTYRGYYTQPQVHAAIGYATHPPQPLGHALAPFREELLQVQMQRAPFWRPAPARPTSGPWTKPPPESATVLWTHPGSLDDDD